MSFEDIKDLIEREEKRQPISTDYVDLTSKKEERFTPTQKPREVVREKIVYVDRPVERSIEKKPVPIVETPIKKIKGKGNGMNKVFMIVIITLVVGAVGVSAYNFYLLNGSNWECFTDKCTEYYDKPTWLNDNCVDGICRFRYQNQDQSVLRSQLEEFPADHSIFCKSFSCDTQILRRAG